MAFYAHPTDLISPGDIFPEIPFSVCVPPVKVARKSRYSPPAKFGAQDLRRVFTLPDEAAQVGGLQISSKSGEDTLVTTRLGLGIFLSWGSQVEADERDLSHGGKAKRKAWLAAPIFRLSDIPEHGLIEDPDSHEQISMREIVRNNLSHNYFFLPSFPQDEAGTEHYVDFRKISAVGIEFFTNGKIKRVATLTEESLNQLFSRLMWFFTRAEYFVRPIQCPKCGETTPIDIRFEGQNFDAEPWE